MPRRTTKNRTGLPRKAGIGSHVHDAWISYICLQCEQLNKFRIGETLLEPEVAYQESAWECEHCHYVHSKNMPLPFSEWPPEYTEPSSLKCQRFWIGFFRVATEFPENYWKQCNACGRVLPAHAFSRHKDWGPLEKQMECRSCKGAINADLNPKRTKQQLFESSIRRRLGDLLLEKENQPINKTFIDELFERFDGCCFKTGKQLDRNDRKSWAIDHILPSRYLYPLTKENAALLSSESNSNKRDRWPSDFYTNSELVRLARITGANLNVLVSQKAIFNQKINVDACVSRFLNVRENSNLENRIKELIKLLKDANLLIKLSPENKKLLGI